MSWVISVVKRIAKPSVPKPIYGRWGTEYDRNQLDTRIDLANEDHCGPCGSYALTKEKKKRYNSLNYEDSLKFGIMQRRSYHRPSNLLFIDSSVSMPLPNACDSLSGDYIACLPESLNIDTISHAGPGRDPNDDDEPPEDGPSPVLVVASLFATYRVTKEQLDN